VASRLRIDGLTQPTVFLTCQLLQDIRAQQDFAKFAEDEEPGRRSERMTATAVSEHGIIDAQVCL
jgi:hypothetical protein